MIRIEHVRHRYGPTTVLDVPAWTAGQGEHHLLLGRSGSGKSTLLHIIAAILQPSEGRIVVADTEPSTLSGNDLDRFRGRNIGIVFQQLHLLPTLTVEQNLLLAPYMAGLPQDRSRVRDVLADLDIPGKAGAYPSELSLGQRQRVAIARAVMNRPRVLLADEPTSSLDDVRAGQVLDLLLGQADEYDATLVVATHDRRITDRFEHRLDLDASLAAGTAQQKQPFRSDSPGTDSAEQRA